MDKSRKFLFEEFAVRGQIVQLGSVWQRAIQHAEYPESLQQVLGQAFAAVGLMMGTLKFDGALNFQVQGEGAISLFLVQGHTEDGLRGMAIIRDGHENHLGKTLADWVGTESNPGQAAIILEPDEGERYQGIVPVEKESLAVTLEQYFHRSEQLETRLWLFADDEKAAGLLLQKMPGAAGVEQDEDGWDRAVALAETITEKELLNLSSDDVLNRLFHEESLRVFDEETVKANCNNCEQRFEKALASLGEKELRDILEKSPVIEVVCDFCSQPFEYDKVDIERLLNDHVSVKGTDTIQ